MRSFAYDSRLAKSWSREALRPSWQRRCFCAAQHLSTFQTPRHQTRDVPKHETFLAALRHSMAKNTQSDVDTMFFLVDIMLISLTVTDYYDIIVILYSCYTHDSS